MLQNLVKTFRIWEKIWRYFLVLDSGGSDDGGDGEDGVEIKMVDMEGLMNNNFSRFNRLLYYVVVYK